jgi:translation initiation factor 5B
VLEVKEEVGLGKTLDVIIYDGTIARGDLMAVGGLDKVIVSKVRALLQPKPLDEIRDPEERFRYVRFVSAAAGVKIAAPELGEAVAGAPLWVVKDESEARELWRGFEQEIEHIRVRADINGVVLKADTLGSLEAIERQLQTRNIAIRYADIGDVSKRDVVEAALVARSDPPLGVVLAFNVKVLSDAEEEAVRQGVEILRSEIIYELLENYEKWAESQRERAKAKLLESYVRPGKFALKIGYVFRRSHPAIVGIDVLGGMIKPRYPIMRRDGSRIGTIHELQKEKKTLGEARAGDELAVSIEGAVIGRNVKEGDVLYTDIPYDQALVLKRELKDLLSKDELAVLEEIIEIKRSKDTTYGMI